MFFLCKGLKPAHAACAGEMQKLLFMSSSRSLRRSCTPISRHRSRFGLSVHSLKPPDSSVKTAGTCPCFSLRPNTFPVVIVLEDPLPVDAPEHHMIHATLRNRPLRSGHIFHRLFFYLQLLYYTERYLRCQSSEPSQIMKPSKILARYW